MLAAPPDDVDGYSIGRLNHYLGYRIKRCGWDTDRVIRVFRRDVAGTSSGGFTPKCELDQRRVASPATADAALHHVVDRPILREAQPLRRLECAERPRRSGGGSAPWGSMFTAPLRFLQLYILRLGFLDGVPGFQVCMFAAFYSFLKKAKMWELERAIPQPDPEAERQPLSPPRTPPGPRHAPRLRPRAA